MVSGERIKHLRRELNMKQEELGEKINVTGAAVGGYERGLRNPSSEVLISLCKLFNVSSDYILNLSDSHNRLYQYNDEIEIAELLSDYTLITRNGKQLSAIQKNQLLMICDVLLSESPASEKVNERP